MSKRKDTTVTISSNGAGAALARAVAEEMGATFLDPGDSDIDDAAIDLAAETMTGDIRDFILDRLKHEQSKAPWHQRSESDQRETVHQVESAVRATVRKAVEIMAGHGRRTIKATIEQITIKDGYKAVLTCSKHDNNRHHLADAQGATVLIVVADPDEFTGERGEVEIVPDQATMLGDGVMVQHSEGDGANGNPLH